MLISVISCPMMVIFGFTFNRKSPINSNQFWFKFMSNGYSFMFGLTANAIMAQYTKLFIGRLRPFFIDICRPVSTINGVEYDFYNMTDCSMLHNVYITDYECRQSQHSETLLNIVEQSQMSFYSAHTSLITYSAIFLCLLISDKIKSRKLLSLKLFLIMSLVLVAIWIGHTRVTDHWHHWEDVAVGHLVGVITAIGCWTVFDRHSKYGTCQVENQQNGSNRINDDDDDNL